MPLYVIATNIELTPFKIGRAKDIETKLRQVRNANPNARALSVRDDHHERWPDERGPWPGYNNEKLEPFAEDYVHSKLTSYRAAVDKSSKECYDCGSENEIVSVFAEAYEAFLSHFERVLIARDLEAPFRHHGFDGELDLKDQLRKLSDQHLGEPIEGDEEVRALFTDWQKAKLAVKRSQREADDLEVRLLTRIGASRGVRGVCRVAPHNGGYKLSEAAFREADPKGYEAAFTKYKRANCGKLSIKPI